MDAHNDFIIKVWYQHKGRLQYGYFTGFSWQNNPANDILGRGTFIYEANEWKAQLINKKHPYYKTILDGVMAEEAIDEVEFIPISYH